MTIDEYNELSELADVGEDRLITGSGRSGVHYELMHVLGRYGIFVMSREEAIKAARKLCDEFIDSLSADNR